MATFHRQRFEMHFVNDNAWILLKISLQFAPYDRINNTPALVQIMAWRRTGDKPLSEPMMVRLPTHITSLGLNDIRTSFIDSFIEENGSKILSAKGSNFVSGC